MGEQLKQEIIRRRVNLYIKRHGVKASWLCQQCGNIDAGLMSRFRAGKKDLWNETLYTILDCLNNIDKI